ncbi:MAG: hypothetical protein ACLVKO_08280 [Dysgonomonas sp.]
MRNKIFVLFAILFFTACSSNNNDMPKPVGYNRIERISSNYKTLATKHFSFSYSDLAYIDTLKTEKENNVWFNIVYPQYQARIYCSYSSINRNMLNERLEDSYRLAYSHATKSAGIQQNLYENPNHRTYGILYDIEGEVATPVQFFLTDSIQHFFRASLYYDTKVKADSVSPITRIMREDIMKMIESFEWGN